LFSFVSPCNWLDLNRLFLRFSIVNYGNVLNLLWCVFFWNWFSTRIRLACSHCIFFIYLFPFFFLQWFIRSSATNKLSFSSSVFLFYFPISQEDDLIVFQIQNILLKSFLFFLIKLNFAIFFTKITQTKQNNYIRKKNKSWWIHSTMNF